MLSDKTYSAWNWKTGRFDYYVSKKSRPYRELISYPRTNALHGLGAIAEESANSIPVDAEYIGSGDVAVGTVAAVTKRSKAVFIVVALAGLWLLKGR